MRRLRRSRRLGDGGGGDDDDGDGDDDGDAAALKAAMRTADVTCEALIVTMATLGHEHALVSALATHVRELLESSPKLHDPHLNTACLCAWIMWRRGAEPFV